MDEEFKSVYTPGKIRVAIGFILLFSGILGLICPSTFMWWWNYVPVFFFGIAGYYAFLPLISLLGLYFIFKRILPFRLGKWHWLLGFFLLYLAAMSLLSHLSFRGQEGFDEWAYESFLESFRESTLNYGAELRSMFSLGGGLVGFALSLAMNFSNEVVYYLLFSAAVLLALIIIYHRQIWHLFLFLRAKAVTKKAERRRLKEEKEEQISIGSESQSEEPIGYLPPLREEEPAPVAEEPIQEEELTPEPEAEPEPEPLPEKPIDIYPLPSRRTLYKSEPPAPDKGIPQEVESPKLDSQSFLKPQRSGLVTAVFDMGSNSPIDPNFLKPREVEEVTPAPQATPMAEPEPVVEETPEESLYPEVEETPIAEEEAIQEEPIIVPAPALAEEAVEPTPEPLVEEAPIVPESAPAKQEKAQEEMVLFGPSCQPKAKKRPGYKFPGAEFLKEYPEDKNAAQNEADAIMRSQLIDQSLADLGIGAHVESHTIGPGVTRYNIKSDPSVKVQAIKNVVEDIMIRLGGVLGRFASVVPGSSCSGLEIPNNVQAIVPFKETFEALPKRPQDNMIIPFGKSIEGKIVYGDLSEFPHMLVAGTTGSGKSIFMHGMLMTLIMRNRPEDLKLILIDPKRVEMSKYNELPHLLCPPIKDPGQAKVAFLKLVEEMERRYTLFENSGVSQIREFNADVAPKMGCEKLPFIVAVVDEYADLVDSCKDVNEPVTRLAQKARAAGIHLIIATQRPDVRVIEGRLKANIGTRVALSVSSSIDSSVILGEGGAEKLSGHGDMLVSCAQVSRIGFTRLQGCFVTGAEISQTVSYIRSQQRYRYDPNFLDLSDHSDAYSDEPQISPATAAQMREAQGEDKYQMIKEIIMTRDYASISAIQREFGVGFPRAGKIFARLEAEGVIAKNDNSTNAKGRKVIKHADANPSVNPGNSADTDFTLNLDED